MSILKLIAASFALILMCFILSCDKDPVVNADKMQLYAARIGQVSLSVNGITQVPSGEDIVLSFTAALDATSLNAIKVYNAESGEDQSLVRELADLDKLLVLTMEPSPAESTKLILEISDELKGAGGEIFDGISFEFQIEKAPLELIRLTADGKDLLKGQLNEGISLEPLITLEFSESVPGDILPGEVFLVGSESYSLNLIACEGNICSLQPSKKLGDLEKMLLLVSEGVGESVGRPFEPQSYQLISRLDSTPDFPLLDDDVLLNLIQAQTFRYFWEGAHGASGMARERNTSGSTVTAGGSGFGLMAMVVAVERGFISRTEALDRWERIIGFLETADRFHGAWPHWMDGNTGDVRPFSDLDNGGDLVETAFLVQGLLAVRQYLDPDMPGEKSLIDRINVLWEEVEWDWYTQGGQKVLYWHWSPNYQWQMNLPIHGHNETQIVYILAASSPTHSIDKEVYEKGYARNGSMRNGNSYYGIELPLGYGRGGPLFFAHYSYLGLDPRNLQDQYAHYWQQNTAHTLINRAYCVTNPKAFIGYSADCWGLTASDNQNGYSAHSPDNDLGVITPTAAISSLPYAPEECMRAIRFFYYVLGDRIWGEYGFRDAFNLEEGWTASSYLAIDQGPIVCMIENYRSGLLWDLFMSAPELSQGLDKLGFSY